MKTEFRFQNSTIFAQNTTLILKSRFPIAGTKLRFENGASMSFIFTIFDYVEFLSPDFSNICCFCSVAEPGPKYI